MSDKFISTLFFLVLFTLGFSSCSDPVNISLSKADNKLVDSMYNLSVREVRTEMDSVCEERQKVWLKTYIDSIKQQRLLEISDLLEQG